MKWETDCGNPNTPETWWEGKTAKHRVMEHPTKKSAQTRMLKSLEEMRQIGRVYNHQLQLDAESAIEQVKSVAFDHLPLNEWRGWSVTDGGTAVTVVVRVRRTE